MGPWIVMGPKVFKWCIRLRDKQSPLQADCQSSTTYTTANVNSSFALFLPAAEHAGLQVAPKKVVIWEKWVPTFSHLGKVGSYIFSFVGSHFVTQFFDPKLRITLLLFSFGE